MASRDWDETGNVALLLGTIIGIEGGGVDRLFEGATGIETGGVTLLVEGTVGIKPAASDSELGLGTWPRASLSCRVCTLRQRLSILFNSFFFSFSILTFVSV
jgi:hypothetical protein